MLLLLLNVIASKEILLLGPLARDPPAPPRPQAHFRHFLEEASGNRMVARIRLFCCWRFCVAMSFLSSHWGSGNIMPRIPVTVGSIKSWDATLTQTVRVGCSELHSPNESGVRSSLRAARTPFLAPRGVRASHDSYTRAHRVLRCPSDGLRVPRMVFWRANVATA